MATTLTSTLDVENLVNLFTSLSAEPSYKQLNALVNENVQLRERNASLATTSDEHVRVFARMQQQIDEGDARTAERTSELERAVVQAAELRNQLQEAGNEVIGLKSEIKAAMEGAETIMADCKKKESELCKATASLENEKSVAAKLRSAEQGYLDHLEKYQEELGQAKTRLSQVDRFTVKMIQPSPDDIEKQLDKMFLPSCSLMHKYFGTDLGPQILNDTSCWEAIRGHPSIVRLIPLPASNSTVAKNMRTAASLAILASVLAEYVFRPTYLLSDNELSNILSELVMQDSEKERHFRLLLHGTSPERQKHNIDKRVQEAAMEMMKHTGSLLAPDLKHKFMLDLEDLCQKLCSRWREIQKLEDRIEPDFTFILADETDDWEVLQFPVENGTQPEPVQNGVSPVQNGESAQWDGGEHNISAIKKDTAVLWPAFLAFKDGDYELFKFGLVLDEAQVEAARAEETSHFQYGNRRQQRQARRNSIMRNGSELGRRPFLSTGAGSPSEGD